MSLRIVKPENQTFCVQAKTVIRLGRWGSWAELSLCKTENIKFCQTSSFFRVMVQLFKARSVRVAPQEDFGVYDQVQTGLYSQRRRLEA